MTEKTAASEAADPMARAVEAFGRNLTITVDKKSSVIGLDFTNPNRTVSAEWGHRSAALSGGAAGR